MTARRAAVAVLAALLLAPAACSHDGPKAGEAHLEVDGRARVERADGSRDTIDDSTDLASGDRVSMTEGVGRMELADGVRFELRAHVADADDSVVHMGGVPELEAGELLVSVPGDEPFAVEAAGTSVEIGKGSARLARALGVGVAAYDASVHVDSAGQERDVPALRQMQVPALGRPPQAPRPITYTETDPWDRRFLGEAIDLDRSLESLRRGYTANLRTGQGRSVAFYKTVYPKLADEPGFDASLLDPQRVPADTLVGAAITQLGQKGSFPHRWDDVFAFHEAGAAWGIVALDQGVRSTPLLTAVADAIAGAPLGFTDQPGDELAGPATTTPTSPTTPTTTGGQSQGGPGTSTPGTTPTTPPTSPPATVPPVVPITVPSGPLDPVLDPVVDLVNGLLGGLLGGGP